MRPVSLAWEAIVTVVGGGPVSMWRRESLEEKQGVAEELVRETVRSHFSRCGWVGSRAGAQGCLLFSKQEG